MRKNNPMYGRPSINKGKFRENSPNWRGGFPHCIECDKVLKNRYAKRCTKCYFIWFKKNVKFPSRKGKLNSMFGKKRPDLAGYNKTHPMKGKDNPAYQKNRTKIDKYCIDCGKKLSSIKTIRCTKCHFKNIGIWNKNKKIGRKTCIHHLDLNKKNNLKVNRLKLTNSQHAKFHSHIYRYVIAKFGIKEILKYKKWFLSRRIK
jgi:hypothetical protein